MSDHEVANIVWDEFDESNHHIVPHQGGKSVNEAVVLGDFLKKPQYEVGNEAGKSTSNRGSRNKNVLLGKEQRAFCPSPKGGSSTVPEGSSTHASRKVVPAFYDPNSFNGFTSLTSQDDAGLVFVENEQLNRKNDLPYHDLPDIGNFEDIDRLLRTCDSTFGQGSSIAEELSWFSSSSHSTYGIGDTSKSCSQSSVLGPASLNGTPAYCSSITNILPGKNLLAADSDKSLSHGYQSFALVSDSENKGDCPLQEKTYDGGGGTEIKSTLMHVSNGSSLNECENLNTLLQINMHSKQLEDNTYLKEMKNIDLQNLQENQIWGSDSSSYMHTFSPDAQLEGSRTLYQDLFTQTASSILSGSEYNPSSSCKVSAHVGNYFPHCMENLPLTLSKPPAMTPEEINEKPCLRQNLCSALTVKHLPHLAPSTSITSCQEQHHRFQQETRGDSVQKDKSLELPATNIDSSTVQESPYMISASSDDISLKAISFQQLQDVVVQLDVGAKLCIRDSLYRLARNAEKRHNFACANNSSRESRGGILDTEEPNRYAEYITTETETNPVYHSIAHLLCHRPSQTATRSVESSMLLESHMIDEQIHGHITASRK
ncbi:protein LNK1-like isoform X4 [Phoenix dactylifera]|uniref:Protein LNK1-like isoform X4 n=1 Tax=Phoenix dactylifera TaxID=42345 RepID=A0A8B8J541_PHODC|nr:protein LNK1-like isoform X4 [Phoenix dactylifera]